MENVKNTGDMSLDLSIGDDVNWKIGGDESGGAIFSSTSFQQKGWDGYQWHKEDTSPVPNQGDTERKYWDSGRPNSTYTSQVMNQGSINQGDINGLFSGLSLKERK
ncbi:MAG: hypothetical protein LBR91_01965 [Puniceicoccales bacterium]|jgi:hypothetical protein|nr:hypothetical protein [Puniceicoccales bacterium]